MPDNINIQHFHYKGDPSKREQVLNSFDLQQWPLMGVDRILIVRKLHVRGPWWEVSSKAAAFTQVLQHTAVHALKQDSNTATAVFFNHQTELLAALVSDISTKNEPWYWHDQKINFSLPTNKAICKILTDNILYLPGIFEILEDRNMINIVMSHLASKDLAIITQRISTECHWSLSQLDLVDSLKILDLKLKATPITPYITDDNHHTPLFSEFVGNGGLLKTTPNKVFDVWKQIIQKSTPHNTNSIVNFTAILFAWRYTPSSLSSKNEILSHWKKEILGSCHKNNSPSKITHTKQEYKAPLPKQNTKIELAGEVVGDKVVSAKVIDDKLNNDDLISNEYTGLISQTGGIFYLLNIIKQPVAQKSISENNLCPWHYILRLALWLKLDLDQTIEDFLIYQLRTNGYTINNRQNLYELSTIYNENVIFTKLTQRYSQINKSDLRAALTLPARICENGAYIDIQYHYNSVSLPIRMVGLDIDPGWLTWLGRVVRFHYIDDPALIRKTVENSDANI